MFPCFLFMFNSFEIQLQIGWFKMVQTQRQDLLGWWWESTSKHWIMFANFLAVYVLGTEQSFQLQTLVQVKSLHTKKCKTSGKWSTLNVLASRFVKTPTSQHMDAFNKPTVRNQKTYFFSKRYPRNMCFFMFFFCWVLPTLKNHCRPPFTSTAAGRSSMALKTRPRVRRSTAATVSASDFRAKRLRKAQPQASAKRERVERGLH